jgi:hypothetical protein
MNQRLYSMNLGEPPLLTGDFIHTPPGAIEEGIILRDEEAQVILEHPRQNVVRHDPDADSRQVFLFDHCARGVG